MHTHTHTHTHTATHVTCAHSEDTPKNARERYATAQTRTAQTTQNNPHAHEKQTKKNNTVCPGYTKALNGCESGGVTERACGAADITQCAAERGGRRRRPQYIPLFTHIVQADDVSGHSNVHTEQFHIASIGRQTVWCKAKEKEDRLRQISSQWTLRAERYQTQFVCHQARPTGF